MQASTSEPRCDVCAYRTGFNDYNDLDLIRCTECQLMVHKQCYGMPTYLRGTFVCWACQAVGKSFQAESHLGDGTRLTIRQETRPSRCDLCSVATGVHAMHPLYDMHGERGRQLFLKDPEPRLVWVHTLCAFFLSSRGLCFGCTRSGYYDDDSHDDHREDGDESDDRSANPDLADDDDDVDHDGSPPIHHFVYYLLRPGEQHTPWTRAVQKQKKDLKCTICGANDKPNCVLRIPLQCSANDPSEAREFRGRHPSLGVDSCTLAFHVGCAMWGGMNPNNVLRVHYHPGNQNRVPIGCAYCTVHGEDVDKKYQRKKAEMEKARKEEQKARRLERLSQKSTSSPAAPRSSSSTKPWGPDLTHAASAPDQAVLPSLARRNFGRKQMKPKAKQATTKPDPKPPKKKWYDNLDKSIAAPVSSVARPTLAKKRKVLASQKSVVTEEVLERVTKDLKVKLVPLAKDERKKVLKERKKLWKRELSELESSDFANLWGQAKNAVGAAIVALEGMAQSPLDEDPGDVALDLSMDDDNVDPSEPAAVAPPESVGKSGREADNEDKEEQLPKGGEKGSMSCGEVQTMEIDNIGADDPTIESVDGHSKSVAAKTQVGGARETNIGAYDAGTSPADSANGNRVDIGTEVISTPNQERVPPTPQDISNRGTDVPAIVDESKTEANPHANEPDRWEYLAIGPHFRNEPYEFGEWDEMR